ncbi:pentapeptide repeat-containing protein [Dyella sp. M7H15-1]|uniref:pentapeptide repeat-containing protein n=1 Tax=Dyella sp. M7H15-1 TaxID=2501295 RepID=UPI0013E8E647|nr:pentapeptide repeat-containing protein [Dyella sp. M7H15-1]
MQVLLSQRTFHNLKFNQRLRGVDMEASFPAYVHRSAQDGQNHLPVSPEEEARRAYLNLCSGDFSSRLTSLTTLASIEDPGLMRIYTQNINNLPFEDKQLLPIPELIREMSTQGPDQERQMVDFVNNLDLTDVTFEDADFNGLRVSGLKLSNISLTNPDFRNARLENCEFKGVVMDRANFSSATIIDTRMIDCSLFKMNMSQTKQICSTYERCDMPYTNFSESILKYLNLSSSHLTRCNFEGAEYSETSFPPSSIRQEHPEKSSEDEIPSYEVHPFVNRQDAVTSREPRRERNNTKSVSFLPLSSCRVIEINDSNKTEDKFDFSVPTSEIDQHGERL